MKIRIKSETGQMIRDIRTNKEYSEVVVDEKLRNKFEAVEGEVVVSEADEQVSTVSTPSASKPQVIVQEVDLSKIEARLKKLEDTPVNNTVDLSGIETRLKDLEEAPEREKADLSEIETRLTELEDGVAELGILIAGEE